MKLFLLLIILLTLSFATFGQTKPSPNATNVLSPSIIESIVIKEFGNKIKYVRDLNSDAPFLLGDFNGDNYSDLPVLLNIEEGKSDIATYGISFVDTNPYSPTNGRKIDPFGNIGQNCLAVGVMHGSSYGYGDFKAAAKYLTYECFSAFHFFSKKQIVRRGSGSNGLTTKPKGDSIKLDLETGGTSLIYWNGTTYKGFGLRIGD